MGRQINFYIDEEIKKKIFEFIFAKGFIVYGQYQNSMKTVIVTENLLQEQLLLNRFFLYKEEYGELEMKEEYRDGKINLEIYSYSAPVIELSLGSIDHDNKSIFRGRVYVVLQYFDESGNNIEKTTNIGKDYNALLRFIKKNVPNQDVPKGENGEYITKVYATDSIKDLAHSGYRLW